MKRSAALTAALLACAALPARPEVYFREDFAADDLGATRWVVSEVNPPAGGDGDDGDGKKAPLGKFELSSGPWFADEKKNRGLRTTEDARYYLVSAPLDRPLDTSGKDLVVQFSVKHPQDIDCGGGYLKLLPPDFSPKNFTSESPYEILFGPDICGSSKRVHLIISYKGDNKLKKEDIPCPADELTHLYTLIVKPDQTYKVLVDQEKVASGSLLDDWDFLPPKTVKDPDAKKPEDWVDKAMIDDPEDIKPEGQDDTPKYIADPEAKKPEEWDDDADGEWTAPKIENPEYKGQWEPKKIKNPDYKGPWVHPDIPNPDHVPDDSIYVRKIGYVGFDLWQVKSGTIFDDIIITDSVEEAEEAAKADFEAWKDKESEAKETFEEKEANETEEIMKKVEEEMKQEALQEKVAKVVEAEELAAIEENEPIEDSLGGSLADTLAGVFASAGHDAAAAVTGGASGTDKSKEAVKDEL